MTAPHVLFVAWQCQANRAIYPVARLVVQDDSPRYEFVYIQGVRDALKEGFVPFAGMRSLERVYKSDELFPLFSNRIMPASRPDFGEHVSRLGLSGEPEPVLLLARSEGRKLTDNLEAFAPPEFNTASNSWVYTAFARGVRHQEGAEDAVRALQPGDALTVEPDPTNEWDARALLMLTVRHARIGYVPHTLVEDINRLIDSGGFASASVVRVNMPPAPVHQRVLVQINAEHAEGFRPLSTARYAPIPLDATCWQVRPSQEAH